MKTLRVPFFTLILVGCSSVVAFCQQATYPAELRGYKVDRVAVEALNSSKIAVRPDQLIRFGKIQVARVTPAGVTLELPIIVAPVKQKGQVDFLVFEDIVVNGMPVRIDEYHRRFELPNRKELILKEPLKFFVTLPNAVLAALGEWAKSQEKWRVTGRIYVFGRYKKFLFSFKRTVPIELDLLITNPLKTV